MIASRAHLHPQRLSWPLMTSLQCPRLLSLLNCIPFAFRSLACLSSSLTLPSPPLSITCSHQSSYIMTTISFMKQQTTNFTSTPLLQTSTLPTRQKNKAILSSLSPPMSLRKYSRASHKTPDCCARRGRSNICLNDGACSPHSDVSN